MRTGVTQASPTAHPDMRVTVGGDIYASVKLGEEEARLVTAEEDEQVWGGKYEFLIDNSDGALNGKDYEGKLTIVSHSFVGETGSALGFLLVDSQDFISVEGKLLMRLVCFDLMGLMSKIKGTIGGAYWNFPWQSTEELAKLTLPQSGEPLPATLISDINRVDFLRSTYSSSIPTGSVD